MIVDTNVWIRHLTGDPPEQAEVAREFLSTSPRIDLPDVVVAECVWVLESVYGVERWRIAEMMRSALELAEMLFYDGTQLRALELYETLSLDYVDAYVLAHAEWGHYGPVATFDRELKRKAQSHGVLLLGE
jgi:predicted nucleic acid-binding protein